MSDEILCVKEEIEALPTADEKKAVLRVLIKRGVLVNTGTKEKPVWMFGKGACLKHPRGCSF